ncbi:hypothetical protein Tco_0060951 [Tanacetum coccineum]
MKKNRVHLSKVQNLYTAIGNTFNEEVFPRVEDIINEIVKANLRRIFKEEMHKETTSVTNDFRSLITSELATLLLVKSKNFYKDSPDTQADDPDIWVALKEIDDDEPNYEEVSP